MPRGMKIPIGVDITGRTAMVESDDYAWQTIAMALSSDESANAFQQGISIGDEPIFKGDTTEFRAAILRRLYEIFDGFEKQKLFRLMRETVSFTMEAEGELKISFRYIDLESDKPKEFSKNYSTRP